jgi:hypothetical protein
MSGWDPRPIYQADVAASEGSYLVPTVGDGKAYGTALASVLARGH